MLVKIQLFIVCSFRWISKLLVFIHWSLIEFWGDKIMWNILVINLFVFLLEKKIIIKSVLVVILGQARVRVS